jgi:putative phosphoribosyl transferase
MRVKVARRFVAYLAAHMANTDFDATEMVFRNRAVAGRMLAGQLAAYRHRRDVVVLGIPHGGVIVAREVAHALHAPLQPLIAAQGLDRIQRRASLLGAQPPLPLEGCTVIVVDDGLATGATMRAALTALRAERPAWIVVALPVGPPDAQDLIGTAVDEFVCVASPPGFSRIVDHYVEFAAVSDNEVRAAFVRPSGGR